jgi:hypothetical protein
LLDDLENSFFDDDDKGNDLCETWIYFFVCTLNELVCLYISCSSFYVIILSVIYQL